MEVVTNVDPKRISDLLCCAFEGGSNYWYLIFEFQEPTEFTYRSDPARIYKHLDYPVNPGGWLHIETLEKDEIDGQTKWKLDLDAIKRGLELMAKESPEHSADFMAENEDATTGDVFLQYCLFGKVVFG